MRRTSSKLHVLQTLRAKQRTLIYFKNYAPRKREAPTVPSHDPPQNNTNSGYQAYKTNEIKEDKMQQIKRM